MKNKFYFLSLCACFAASFLTAQCTVNITSLSSSGMTVIAHASGTGNINPGYEWFWDDSTNNTTTYSGNANHTYLYARGYQICVTYTDTVNPFNCIANDCDSIYLFSPSGIAANTELKAELKTGPNPFTSSTHISLSLNKPGNVEISIYDITGNEIETLQSGPLDSGIHLFTWKPETLSNGIYFLKMTADKSVQTKKIVYTGNQ